MGIQDGDQEEASNPRKPKRQKTQGIKKIRKKARTPKKQRDKKNPASSGGKRGGQNVITSDNEVSGNNSCFIFTIGSTLTKKRPHAFLVSCAPKTCCAPRFGFS